MAARTRLSVTLTVHCLSRNFCKIYTFCIWLFECTSPSWPVEAETCRKSLHKPCLWFTGLVYVVTVYIYINIYIQDVRQLCRTSGYGSFWVKDAVSIFSQVSTVISLLTSCFKILLDTVRHQTLWTSFTLNPTSKVRRWSSRYEISGLKRGAFVRLPHAVFRTSLPILQFYLEV